MNNQLSDAFLLDCLVAMREMVDRECQGLRVIVGICRNLDRASTSVHGRPGLVSFKQYDERLAELASSWPGHSGDPKYPVPHAEMSPYDAYCDTRNLWEGEYGASRVRLLDHLIGRLRMEMEAVK